MQANGPNTRVNEFLVDFMYDVFFPPQNVIDKLEDIRLILWSHNKGNIIACSLSCPPIYGVPESEKNFKPAFNGFKWVKDLNTMLEKFSMAIS